MSNLEAYCDFLETRFKELGLEGYAFHFEDLRIASPITCCKKIIFPNWLVKAFEESDKDEHELLLACALHEAGHREKADTKKNLKERLFEYSSIPLFFTLFFIFVIMLLIGRSDYLYSILNNQLPLYEIFLAILFVIICIIISIFYYMRSSPGLHDEDQADYYAKKHGYGDALADALHIIKENKIDMPFKIKNLHWEAASVILKITFKILELLNPHPPPEDRVTRLRDC